MMHSVLYGLFELSLSGYSLYLLIMTHITIVTVTRSVSMHDGRVFRSEIVEPDTERKHPPETEYLRRVRIANTVILCVVQTMNGNPFLDDHSGRNPADETKEVVEPQMELDRPVCL